MKEEFQTIGVNDFRQEITELRETLERAKKSESNFDEFFLLECKIENNRFRLLLSPKEKNIRDIDFTKYYNAFWWGENNDTESKTIRRLGSRAGEIWTDVPQSVTPSDYQVIRLYLPDFLRYLSPLWQDQKLAETAIKSIIDLIKPTRAPKGKEIRLTPINDLRKAQKEAFDLINFSTSFLWGPPGTGKSTTLGYLIAQYLQEVPSARILLIASTHDSIDDIAYKVDDALSKANQHKIRLSINRYGSKNGKISVENKLSRWHLAIKLDDDLKKKFVQILDNSDSGYIPRNIYTQIYDEDFVLKEKKLEDINGDRLLCMTAAAATTNFSKLQASGKFDLVIFEEASQISLPYSLMLMSLGHKRLFAGDPKQLPPVVKDESDDLIFKWLGRSVFDYMGDASKVCILNEQTRMAPPICHLVSKLFYEGRLHFASSSNGHY